MLLRTGNHLVQQNELSLSNTRLSNYKTNVALAKVIALIGLAIRCMHRTESPIGKPTALQKVSSFLMYSVT